MNDAQLSSRVLDAADECIVVCDVREPDSPIVYVNDAFEDLTGYSAEECIGRNCRFLQGERTSEGPVERLRRAIERRESTTVVLLNQHADGSWFWNELSISPVYDSNDEVTHYVGIQRDVSRRVRAEQERDEKREQLERRAHYDWLTGLPNRARFREEVREAIRAYRDAATRSAVMFLDLDNFKQVNDSLGHPAGDRVLKKLAERLRQVTRPKDMLARAGGDEFKVLIRDLADVDLDSLVTNGLEEVFGPPLVIDNERIHIKASVGVVETTILEERDLDQVEAALKTLTRAADRALYRAKESQGTSYQSYDPGDESFEDFVIQRENRLREAVSAGDIRPRYQPIYRIEGDDVAVAAIETLARWEDPDFGTIMPGEFIPLAEMTGLIGPLTKQLVRQACDDLRFWNAPENIASPASLFINLSPTQLDDKESVEELARVVENECLDIADIWFEVTESSLLEHLDRLQWIQDRGHGIVVDDFGTGFSSLERLRELSVDALKIDMSFVHGIADSRADRAVIKGICTMGRHLGIRVIAEGVETPEQLDFLRRQGCQTVQGYLLDRPSRNLEFVDTHAPLSSD